jgi:hypothetical protein
MGVMEKDGHECTVISAITLVVLAILAWLYVDDTDLTNLAKNTQESGEQILNRIQAALSCWTGTLRATGGDINAEKSYYYIMDSHWTNSTWRPRSISHMPGNLLITNEAGTNVELLRKELSDASKTLGIFIAPDANQVQQTEYLQNKAEDLSMEMRVQGPKTKTDNWIQYTLVMRKTMDYPMAATQIEREEWDEIMTLINKVALPRSGLVRTFPHAILYGPKKFQGSGQQHPFYMQEILHIYELVKEINQSTQQGKQYCITLEQLKMETGFPGPFTQVPYAMAASTTTSMIKNIWKFCHTHKISIEDDFGSLPLRRMEDEYLMPSFLLAGYTEGELKMLNEGRCFLHAITLADICTPKGNHITLDSYHGRRATQFLHHYDWPRDPPSLSKAHWDLWKKAVTKCFLRYDTDENERKLMHPLGSWLIDPTTHWQWFYDHISNSLFTPNGDSWHQYRTTRESRHQKQASPI